MLFVFTGLSFRLRTFHLHSQFEPKKRFCLAFVEHVKFCHGMIAPQHSHRSETKGITERADRRVQEGTSAALLQSGSEERWWSDSVECSCYLRNVRDLLADWKTPHERRFGKPFRGPTILSGAMVEYQPISPRDQARFHQFAKNVSPGVFLGFELVAVRLWNGDILKASLQDLQKVGSIRNSSSKNQHFSRELRGEEGEVSTDRRR